MRSRVYPFVFGLLDGEGQGEVTHFELGLLKGREDRNQRGSHFLC